MEAPFKETILFENVILNIQKFISSLGSEMPLSDEDKFFLTEEMAVYAIVIMSLFLKNTYNNNPDEYDKLHAEIIEQYKKFTWENCGADNEKDKEYYWDTIKNNFFEKLTFIGFSESKENAEKEKIVTTITMDHDLMKFNHPAHGDIFKKQVTQLVNEIEMSAKNFSSKIP